MPQGVYPEANAKTAGEEISSTYEGRHVTLEESLLIHPTTADGLVDKGHPVVFNTAALQGVGIAFKSAAATTDLIAIDTEGIWVQSVVANDDNGGSAVRVGDLLYINVSTAVISKIAARATSIPFGYALGNIDSGLTRTIAVKIHYDPQPGLNSVGESQIVNLAVTEGKIGAKAVATAKIADAAITPAQVKTKAAVALADDNVVVTATQMVDSGIFTMTPTVARTLTTANAADIIAALPEQQVGTWFDITVIALAAFNVTLTAGDADVTIVGSAVANNNSATFKCRVASATTVVIYRM